MSSSPDGGITSFRGAISKPVDRYASVAEQREKDAKQQEIAQTQTNNANANAQRFGQHARTERSYNNNERSNERYNNSERSNERSTERANERYNDRSNERSNERYNERSSERYNERSSERSGERSYDSNRGGRKQYGFNEQQQPQDASSSSYQSNDRRSNYGQRQQYNDRNERNDRGDRNDRQSTQDRSNDRYNSRSASSDEPQQSGQRRTPRPAPANLPDLDALQLNDPARPKLKLAPRGSIQTASEASPSSSSAKPSPFGEAKPREDNLATKPATE